MPTYAELQQQIATLQQQAQAARKAEIASVVADIKSKMQEYGITVADLSSGARGSRAKGATVAAKYRDPETGDTWTGRGKRPRWLQARINAGRTLESFLIA